MPQPGALDGVFVLDLSRLLPGPYCSMILGDHGARVVAVEDRRFLADGLFINIINRNKEHMTLNLKSSKGREIFHQLAKKADVLIEGFRPGVVRRLGVDYESVRSINPKIVYCSVTGYGQNGPLRDHVGHDVEPLDCLEQRGVDPGCVVTHVVRLEPSPIRPHDDAALDVDHLEGHEVRVHVQDPVQPPTQHV